MCTRPRHRYSFNCTKAPYGSIRHTVPLCTEPTGGRSAILNDNTIKEDDSTATAVVVVVVVVVVFGITFGWDRNQWVMWDPLTNRHTNNHPHTYHVHSTYIRTNTKPNTQREKTNKTPTSSAPKSTSSVRIPRRLVLCVSPLRFLCLSLTATKPNTLDT